MIKRQKEYIVDPIDISIQFKVHDYFKIAKKILNESYKKRFDKKSNKKSNTLKNELSFPLLIY